MQAKENSKLGRQMSGPFLAMLLSILVVSALWLFARGAWWFPTLASMHGADIDRMFLVTLVIVGTMFVLLQLTLGYFSLRYSGSKGATSIPVGVSYAAERRFALIAAAIIFLVDAGLAVMGEGAWFKLYGEAPRDALLIEVTGEQFMWNVRYPGRDGQFGRTDPRLVSSDNQLGLDRSDPAAKDDIVLLNQMHLPVNRPVRIRLGAKDVIHSFFLPNFRIKQDCVPGMKIEIWFVPNRIGEYEIACAQLCGLGHYRMRGFLTVQPQDEFEKWLAEQSVRGGI